ncbi:MAG: hypothetical protein JNN13_12775, partial [Planctomycetes bacterium]|nr:hypothetical protein [Planctomycetota bacterium]
GVFESSAHLEPSTPDATARAFEREWAESVLGAAMARLEARYVDRPELLSALRPLLVACGERGAGLTAAAVKLGRSVNATTVALSRMRDHLAEAIRAEVASTVADDSMIDEEIAALRIAFAT